MRRGCFTSADLREYHCSVVVASICCDKKGVALLDLTLVSHRAGRPDRLARWECVGGECALPVQPYANYIGPSGGGQQDYSSDEAAGVIKFGQSAEIRTLSSGGANEPDPNRLWTRVASQFARRPAVFLWSPHGTDPRTTTAAATTTTRSKIERSARPPDPAGAIDRGAA